MMVMKMMMRVTVKAMKMMMMIRREGRGKKEEEEEKGEKVKEVVMAMTVAMAMNMMELRPRRAEVSGHQHINRAWHAWAATGRIHNGVTPCPPFPLPPEFTKIPAHGQCSLEDNPAPLFSWVVDPQCILTKRQFHVRRGRKDQDAGNVGSV